MVAAAPLVTGTAATYLEKTMTKTEQVLSLIKSGRPWPKIKIVTGVDEADLVELFRSGSRDAIAKVFYAKGVDQFYWDLLNEAHPPVPNGVTSVDEEWQVGFRMPDGNVLDLGRWAELATARGIFSACLWLVTGRGNEPRVGSSYRTFVEGRLSETSFNLRSSAA